ncbi:MAG: translation elongation factor Ts [Patescibacteria group bacterium]|nr:translation elongation factor Ts [Patescibacteria group bacterium]
MVTLDKIKQLRNITGLSIMECKKALEEVSGDVDKAKEILKKLGKDFAGKRTGSETKEGIVDSYIHSGKKMGVLLELNCESDFVARSEDFQKLAHEICLQITAVSSEETPLLEQQWIRDEAKTIKDLVNEYIARFGENITIKRFIRYEL